MDSDFWNLCHRLGDSLSPFILILSLNVLRTLSLSLSCVRGTHPNFSGNPPTLGGRPCQEGAGEGAQASLGRAGTPAKRQDHLGGSGRAVPCPRSRATLLLIQGGGAPDVRVSLVAHGGHGPAPVTAETGGSTPECTGESVTTVEAAGRSGRAPETADPRCAVPKRGMKSTAPEQGTSDRPVKKAWVHSKM
jgi:hypothetical protein